MSIGGYKIRDQSATHFITFAVVEWIDVFTRQEYRDIIIDSIKYCQKEKDLILNAWCIMSNHIHLVGSSQQSRLSDILRDFKKYTSAAIIRAIQNNKQESRREWMLRIFHEQGQKNSRNSNYQFWRQDNQPKELYSASFTMQKVNYIHNNPVTAGVVDKAENYLYSSARDYYYGNHCGLLNVTFL